MNEASESILALKPVTFHYKQEFDPEKIPQFGLIAEEVEKVNPALITRDANGKPYTVRYDQVNAMLLNEFLKEHERVEKMNSKVAKQEAIIAQQQREFHATTARQENEIQALTASLREQTAQIQKVTAQMALSPQIVNNQ
jgi:septal ring factor EnvC (AmiA/AmiB activator)